MAVGRLFSAAAGSIAMLLLSTTALAQQPEAPAGSQPADGDEADAPGRGRPIPRDDRTGHVSAFAGLGVVVPGGDIGGGLTFAQVANAGPGAEVGVAVGVSRHSGLELRGQYARLGPSGDCNTCRTEMFAAGLGLTYHTSQALGFDPWVRFGVGYRALLVGGPLSDVLRTAPPAGTFHGIDVASLGLGGDYYPVRWFGLGLFLQGDIGIDVAAPSSTARGAVYGLFQAGFRIALEPQRKAVTSAQAAPERRTAIVRRWDFAPALYNRGGR